MADAQQQRWSAQLRENRPDALSSVDARLAASSRAAEDDAPFDESDDTADRENAYRERLDSRRRQALEAAALDETETSTEAGGADASPQAQAANLAVKKVAGAGWKIADKWLWGFAIPTVGLTVIAIDIIYLSRLFSEKAARLIPKVPTWELIALIVVTVLAAVIYTVALLLLMLPVILGGGAVGTFAHAIGII